MLFPVSTTKEWSKTYGLAVKSDECKCCGKLLIANKPFAVGDWRGLVSESHGCDENYDLFTATRSTKEERSQLKILFSDISEVIQ